MHSVSTRLRWRLLLIALLAVVPALVAIVYLRSVERARIRESVFADNLRLARLAASEQASVFDGAGRLLETLGAIPALLADDRPGCDAILTNVLRGHADFVNLTMASRDGELLCAAAPLDPRLLRSEEARAWYQRALATRSAVLGEPQLSATTGREAIIVALPLLDADGAVDRIVAATISLDQLNRTASQVQLPAGATLTLFDRSMRILARWPDGRSWTGKLVPDSAVQRRLAAGAPEDVREATGVDGVLRLYTTVPVVTSFDAGLYLGIGVDDATAFAASRGILRQYLELLAIVLLAGVGAAAIGGQTFVVGPAKVLKDVANRLAAGDLSARAQLAGGVGGISELAESVNAMAAALDEHQRERDQAEATLRDAEERLRFALNASGMGVWEANLQKDEVHWSETCESMHGLAPGTFGGTLQSYLDLILPDDREAAEQAISQAIASHSAADLEYRTVWPDGSIHRISTTSRFFYDADGVPVRGAGVSIDVTERRLLEEQLRQSLKMEAVGQLAGGVAHDFNNLLTIITGNTELALAALPAEGEVREDLEHAQAAADRAAQLTRQLLAFSRKQVLRVEPVHVNGLVEEIAPMLRRLIGEDISMEFLSDGSDAVTVADHSQLEQALINLAVNARDAMPSGGSLRIVTEIVELDGATVSRKGYDVESGSFVKLTVADTGIGMSHEVLERAFEPFFTTKAVGKGTGLGLPSAYGTVKQFGGHIGIESARGRGTTVTILLPCVSNDQSPAQAGVPGASSATVSGSATVLVVEDEESVRQLAGRMLSRAGFTVLHAANGEEALERTRSYSGEIHLVLSDVVMPGMSAAKLIAEIRSERPRIATLLMSGYPNDEILRKGIRRQDFSLIEKPFTGEALVEKVRQALREHGLRQRDWSLMRPMAAEVA